MKFFKHKNGWAFEVRFPKNWIEVGDIMAWVFRLGATILMATAVWLGRRALTELDEHWVPRTEYAANRSLDLSTIATNHTMALDAQTFNEWRKQHDVEQGVIFEQLRTDMKSLHASQSQLSDGQYRIEKHIARIDGYLSRKDPDAGF